MKNKFTLIVILSFIIFYMVSCDESEECVEKNKIHVEFSTYPTGTVIYENESYYLALPNFITPNSDGINDNFEVYLNEKDEYSLSWIDYLEVKFTVRDKCKEVFSSIDNDNLHWDGKIESNNAPEGIYYYELFAVLPNSDSIDVSGSFELHRF